MKTTASAFRKLTARRQILLLRQYPRLLPRLLHWGLSFADAQALAWHAAVLYAALRTAPPLKNPEDIFERYTLAEIADLSERYRSISAHTAEGAKEPRAYE